VMAGYEGHRGWISRIAGLRSQRGKGIGQSLLVEAERRLSALGCIKLNLQVVDTNASTVAFYESGYRIKPRISMSKRLPSSHLPPRLTVGVGFGGAEGNFRFWSIMSRSGSHPSSQSCEVFAPDFCTVQAIGIAGGELLVHKS
jgi:hypothetical protein